MKKFIEPEILMLDFAEDIVLELSKENPDTDITIKP